MSDFHAHSIVTARKPHKCEHCRKPIGIGEKHRKSVQVHEGDFSAYREHVDCFHAWFKLNFDPYLRNIGHWESVPFLCDDEHEGDDKAWMREFYPHVAERLGWSPEVPR